MGKIFYMMGKSSSGKDTLYRVISESCPELRKVVPYTTRPIREGEQEGVEYHFIDDAKVKELEDKGKVIELRAYYTVHGVWKYLTVDDGQIDEADGKYLMIGTLESYEKMLEYYGKDVMVPIYVEVEDGTRLMRALLREQQQEVPKYEELCRRFLADQKDFSEENLNRLGIHRRFENKEIELCAKEIKEVIYSERI